MGIDRLSNDQISSEEAKIRYVRGRGVPATHKSGDRVVESDVYHPPIRVRKRVENRNIGIIARIRAFIARILGKNR
jgi:hypothetical protein